MFKLPCALFRASAISKGIQLHGSLVGSIWELIAVFVNWHRLLPHTNENLIATTISTDKIQTYGKIIVHTGPDKVTLYVSKSVLDRIKDQFLTKSL